MANGGVLDTELLVRVRDFFSQEQIEKIEGIWEILCQRRS